MKKRVFHLIVLLMVCILVCGNILTVSASQSERAAQNVEVTRLEWLKALTKAFEMKVEADNYPDNYYSDIDSSSADYYDIMLATEFGLVDVEAGGSLRPEDAATREFAAHTLNLCMGYEFLGEKYTFSEIKNVNYPNDIQIAIDEGWLGLEDGNFLPQQAITIAEMDRMISVAVAAVKSTEIDPNYENQYQLAEGVLQIPEDTEVILTNDDELTLYDCKTKIKKGDIFVVVSDGLPIARRAVDVTASDNTMVVKVEGVDVEEAFLSLDAQGTIWADLTQTQTIGDDVALAYIVGGTKERAFEDGIMLYSLEEVEEQAQQVTAVIATKTIKAPDNGVRLLGLDSRLGSETISLSCKITNVTKEYGLNLAKSYAYVKVGGSVTFSCKIGTDKIDLPYFENPFVKVPIGVIGYFEPSAEGSANGYVSLCMKGNLSVGIQKDKNKVRGVFEFKKEAFTIEARAEASLGVKAAIGVDIVFLKAELFAKAGAKAYVKTTTYTDAKVPRNCMHVAAHLYASYGGNVVFKIPGFKTTFPLEQEIFNEKNSPVKVVLHYDDGKPVSECARDQEGGDGAAGSGEKYKYYTPIDSQYAYSGANTGISSDGKEFTIFEYSLDSENKATITKYNGNVSALNIPDTIDGYTVVKIGSNVFKDNSRLVMVTIPDTVTEIKDNAFANCRNLSYVTLSKVLVTMGKAAFADCDNLIDIEIPKSLKTKTNSPFRGCDNLKNITFEKGVTEIPEGLFSQCTGLVEINIPDTVTVLKADAFSNCSNLSKVNFSPNIVEIGDNCFSKCIHLQTAFLPDKLESLGKNAFGNCDELSEVRIPKALITVKETYAGGYSVLVGSYVTGVGPLNNKGPFANCGKLQKITFEEGISNIPDYLFAHCTGIRKVVIPDSVTRIGVQAFDKCENLQEVTLPEGLTTLETCAFGNCSNLTNLSLPNGITTISQWCFAACTRLEEIELPKRLTKIGGGAFCYCTNLNTVKIPKTLSVVDEVYLGGYNQGTSLKNGGPFMYCDNLEHVTFEDNTAIIPNCLFAFCTGLKKIEIPSSITEIGEQAFDSCTLLENVLLKDGLTKVGNDVFAGCVSLKSIALPDTVTEMGNYIFAACSNLENVKLPDITKNITVGLFKNCTSLKTLDLPETVIAIRAKAFQNSGLTELQLPLGVTIIEEYAFQNSALKKIQMPMGVATIAGYAFNNCDSLQSVSIPDSVISLGKYCFADCEVLSDVRLGNGLTEIDSYTFHICPGLKKIDLPYRIKNVKANAFTNCTSLTEVTIPRGTTSIASNAFSYPDKMTVYGVSGTYAEEWAKAEGAAFVSREIPATAVVLNHEKLTMNKGTTEGLILTVTPVGCTDVIEWKSNNTSVATVSDTGVVKAVAAGTATIRVTAGKLSASCDITVVQPVTSIYLNRTNLNLEAENIYKLQATAKPDEANDKSMSWSSSDGSVATVDQNGIVTAVKKGTAIITVKANDGSGVSKDCTVVVTNSVYRCEKAEELESTHNYENNCSDVWIYTVPGAEKVFVTFDGKTNIEKDFDYLYIYDGGGNQIGRYTGKELSGQTVVLPGNEVRIKLVSDNSGNDWGFKVTGAGEYCEHTYSTIWSSDDSYHWHGATCKHTELRKDQEAHQSSDWIVDRQATAEEAGSRHKECTVCGRILVKEEIERIKTPEEKLEERLASAIDGALSTAEVLEDENLISASEEVKKATIDGVLRQIETICREQDIFDLSILPAETALEKVQQLGTVDSMISSLLGTSVTVVAKESLDGLAIPNVQNAILSVPAGENAVIQVAKAETPIIADIEAGKTLALSFDMVDSAGNDMKLKAPVIITMPVPVGISIEDKIYVYHFREGEKDYSERIPIRLNQDGTMSFVTGSFSTFVVANAKENRNISGSISGFGSEETIITLTDTNMLEVRNVRIAAGSTTYVLEDVACGDYMLRVSKKNHAPREYPITVENEDVVQNLELQLWGDITGDGKINARDSKGYYNYGAGQLVLDEYLFKVCDVNGDGRINARDVKEIYNHTAGIYMLW